MNRQRDHQRSATEDERNEERVAPKMSDGRNDAVETNENAPSRTRPASDNSLPLEVPVLTISPITSVYTLEQ